MLDNGCWMTVLGAQPNLGVESVGWEDGRTRCDHD